MKLTEEQFDERFTILKNHLNDDAEMDGHMYETYGKDLKHILELSNNSSTKGYVWTYCDDDDGHPAFVSGYHLVNRIGYLLTNQLVEDGKEFSVKVGAN